MNVKSPMPGQTEYSSRDLASSPLVVFYELTQACDLVCVHCRACAQSRPAPDELSTDDAISLIDQLTEFPRHPLLVMTGGDPLKRADVFLLVEHAVRRGIDVSITPAATPLATTDALRRLKDAGISRLALSLDGADAQTHDRFRGVLGSFQKTIDILVAAKSMGIPIQVNTTLTPANLCQVDWMAELMARLGIVLWSVFFLVPVGRGADIQRLTPGEYEDVFECLWRHSLSRQFAIKTTESPHYRRRVQMNLIGQNGHQRATSSQVRRFTSVGINDGKGVLFVGHTGAIQPSGFLPIKCGVFPRHSVVDVYQRSPLFQALRDSTKLEGKCRLCEFRNICGGSRARAYAVTGNPFAEEPDCTYQPRRIGSRRPTADVPP